MTRQLGLFGDDEAGDGATGSRRSGARGRPIRPAEPTAEIRELATRMPPAVHLGTSSWSFPGWRGLVWSDDDPAPPTARLAREGLAAYAAHPLLRGVGVDRTFYAPVPTETYAGWAAAVPPDFRFLVKTPRVLLEARDRTGATNPAFLDGPRFHDELLAPAAAGLGDRLGTVLVQFPPVRFRRADGPRRFIDQVEQFLVAADAATVPVAVEVRDAILVDDDHAEAWSAALTAAGCAHTYVAHPLMPPVAEQVDRLDPSAGGHVVCRWMLRSGFTYEHAREVFTPFDRMVAPDVPTRRAVASLCRAAVAGGQEVMVIANNKAEGSAPRTLARLAMEIVDPDDAPASPDPGST